MENKRYRLNLLKIQNMRAHKPNFSICFHLKLPLFNGLAMALPSQQLKATQDTMSSLNLFRYIHRNMLKNISKLFIMVTEVISIRHTSTTYIKINMKGR